MDNKGISSFGSILALIGSILIGVGVAWLLADNWHFIPSFLKIIILMSLTGAAYFSGVYLRVKNYYKIGSALIFLGSALYTLSVFLIAQIFSTETSLQGTAILFLISLIGVFFAAYILNSMSSVTLAFLEFFIFVGIQFFAFVEHTNFSGAYFAVIYLLLGILGYSLSLIHSYYNHNFSKLYKIWSAVYFLIFGYILSFEAVLPSLWSYGLSLSNSAIYFILIIAIFSIASFIYGVKVSIKTMRKEIIIFSIVMSLLILVIFASFFVLKDTGSCSAKYCYDLKSPSDCKDSNMVTQCKWTSNYCQEDSCYLYANKNDCNLKIIGKTSCVWDGFSCSEDNCYIYKTESDCNDAGVRLNKTCSWFIQGYDANCIEKNPDSMFKDIYFERNNLCQNITVKDSCTSSNECKWGPYHPNNYSYRNAPLNLMLLWIFSNFIFLALIILIIFYATIDKNPIIVNIAITFFALDILTRYIGFIQDYWGYVSLSLFFITGGVILILGGYGIEKWRRKLIKKTLLRKNTKN